MCSFIKSDLSDTDNIVPFENTTPINLIICSVFFYFDLFSLINRSGIFERYSLDSVDKSESINEYTHTDQQQNKITYSGGVPELPMD